MLSGGSEQQDASCMHLTAPMKDQLLFDTSATFFCAVTRCRLIECNILISLCAVTSPADGNRLHVCCVSSLSTAQALLIGVWLCRYKTPKQGLGKQVGPRSGHLYLHEMAILYRGETSRVQHMEWF